MKFVTDIHDPQRRNPNDFGDPLTFHLPPQVERLKTTQRCGLNPHTPLTNTICEINNVK